VKIIFEAGANHTGLESAKALVRESVAAGADIVKFQTFDLDQLIATSHRDEVFEWTSACGMPRSEPIYHLLKRRCMSEEEWIELFQFASKLGIERMTTVADDFGLGIAKRCALEHIKISSSDIDYTPLIIRALQSVVQDEVGVLHVDTGNADKEDIERVVNLVKRRCIPRNRFVLHHCPKGYDISTVRARLDRIGELRSVCGTVAFSDHCESWAASLAAAPVVDYLEKTITLDKWDDGPEHAMSLPPSEMKKYVQAVRAQEQRETSSITVNPTKWRRGGYAAVDILKGEPIRPEQVLWKRPRMGPDHLTPNSRLPVAGRVIREGEPIGVYGL
jgi:sialic acid synthase SpsE